MGFIGGALGYHVLRQISARSSRDSGADAFASSDDKLTTHFGPEIWEAVRGRRVIDFGCGQGREVVEFAKHGASRAIGIDVREEQLAVAREYAAEFGVAHVCGFVTQTDEKADLIFSLDSFEHFADPAAVLERMSQLLAADGEVWISFGWSWYHPYGGHLFSVFPWAHLIFTEQALIRWRADFKTDGATRFHEVAGGLNQMSIARFERTIQASPLAIVDLTLRPIRPLRWLHNRVTREFTSALVQARLRARIDDDQALARR